MGMIARLSVRVGERLATTSIQWMVLPTVLVAGVLGARDVVRVTRLSRDVDDAVAFAWVWVWMSEDRSMVVRQCDFILCPCVGLARVKILAVRKTVARCFALCPWASSISAASTPSRREGIISNTKSSKSPDLNVFGKRDSSVTSRRTALPPSSVTLTTSISASLTSLATSISILASTFAMFGACPTLTVRNRDMTAGRSLKCGDVVRKVGVCCTGCIDRGRIDGVLWRRDAARCGGFGLLANAGEVANAARRLGDATGTPETRYSLSRLSRPAGCD